MFNSALHVVMKELRVGGTVVYMTKEACAYVDDIVLLARNLDSFRERLGL